MNKRGYAQNFVLIIIIASRNLYIILIIAATSDFCNYYHAAYAYDGELSVVDEIYLFLIDIDVFFGMIWAWNLIFTT